MATAAISGEAEQAREKGYPVGGLRFDWRFVVLAAWIVGGLYLDGWAHNHDKVDDSFFTPWHAVLYSGFAASLGFLAWQQWRNVNKGFAWRRALPQGYFLSLVGAVIFGMGGAGDMVWHSLFGIEGSLADALMSPSHLSLALGMLLIATGPLRAVWRRAGDSGSWRELGPALLTATLTLSVLTFFTGYANLLFNPGLVESGQSQRESLGVSSILIQTALAMGVALLLVKRWRLPFGALTLLFGATNLLILIVSDHYVFLPGAVVTGLLADVLVWWLKPSADKPARFYLFAFVVPLVYYALFFAAAATMGTVRWTVHLWSGSTVIAGVVGLLVAFLLVSPLGQD
jgi:hypothetical protein